MCLQVTQPHAVRAAQFQRPVRQACKRLSLNKHQGKHRANNAGLTELKLGTYSKR